MSETLNDITKAHVAEKFHDDILQKALSPSPVPDP